MVYCDFWASPIVIALRNGVNKNSMRAVEVRNSFRAGNLLKPFSRQSVAHEVPLIFRRKARIWRIARAIFIAALATRVPSAAALPRRVEPFPIVTINGVTIDTVTEHARLIERAIVFLTLDHLD